MCRFFFCLHSFRLAICAIHFGLRVATWLILDRDGKYRGWSEDRHPGEQRLCSKPRKPGPQVLFFRTRSRLYFCRSAPTLVWHRRPRRCFLLRRPRRRRLPSPIFPLPPFPPFFFSSLT